MSLVSQLTVMSDVPRAHAHTFPFQDEKIHSFEGMQYEEIYCAMRGSFKNEKMGSDCVMCDASAESADTDLTLSITVRTVASVARRRDSLA